MGVSAAIIVGTQVASAAVQYQQARKGRKSAEEQGALEREQMAAIEAENEKAMPTADDEDVRRARRKSIVSQMRRRGRQSSILTSMPDAGTALGA